MPELAKGGWDTAVQFGAVGVICFLAVMGLVWFVISQKKDLKESNTKVINLLETTVKECTAVMRDGAEANRDLAASNRELAHAWKSVPCQQGLGSPVRRSVSGGVNVSGIHQQE